VIKRRRRGRVIIEMGILLRNLNGMILIYLFRWDSDLQQSHGE
jgi:hypothetical protein